MVLTKSCLFLFIALFIGSHAWDRTDKPYPVYIEWSSSDRAFHEIKADLSTLSADAPAKDPKFYSTPYTGPVKSYSQQECVQDLMIADIFKNKTGGFFVDLASNDWQELSNSLYFERKLGWNGLCVEAASQYHPG